MRRNMVTLAVAATAMVVAGACTPPANPVSSELISRSSAGVPANGGGRLHDMSDDGRFVVFASEGDNLVAGDTNGESDTFLRDRLLGTTVRVSVADDGSQSVGPAANGVVSNDGRYVAFSSWASDLVADDTNGTSDVFVRDLVAGTTTRVSVGPGGSQASNPSPFSGIGLAISDDGRYVAFTSAANDLVAVDANGGSDAFVHDRQTATTELVSLSSGGAQANGFVTDVTLSGDGNVVALVSSATNLDAADTNADQDVFVRDRSSGITSQVSIADDETQGTAPSPEARRSHRPSLSENGDRVAFVSNVVGLVAADGDNLPDAFVRDRVADTTIWVSQNPGGTQLAEDVGYVVISADGEQVAFDIAWRFGLPLVETAIYRTPLASGGLQTIVPRVALTVSTVGAISGDGRLVGASYAKFDSLPLPAGDPYRAYVYDRPL